MHNVVFKSLYDFLPTRELQQTNNKGWFQVCSDDSINDPFIKFVKKASNFPILRIGPELSPIKTTQTSLLDTTLSSSPVNRELLKEIDNKPNKETKLKEPKMEAPKTVPQHKRETKELKEKHSEPNPVPKDDVVAPKKVSPPQEKAQPKKQSLPTESPTNKQETKIPVTASIASNKGGNKDEEKLQVENVNWQHIDNSEKDRTINVHFKHTPFSELEKAMTEYRVEFRELNEVEFKIRDNHIHVCMISDLKEYLQVVEVLESYENDLFPNLNPSEIQMFL